MWYEFTGLTETQYGWAEDAKIAKAVAEHLERQHGLHVYYDEISEAEAQELNLEDHTGLVCDSGSIEADFDPSLERFPELLAEIGKLVQPVKARQIIDLFEDTLHEGDERHEGFIEMLRQVWNMSPCARGDWMDAYAEDPTRPPHSPVYATDRWVLGIDETIRSGEFGKYDWELLAWNEVPELTGEVKGVGLDAQVDKIENINSGS